MVQIDLSNIDYEVSQSDACIHPRNRALLDLWTAHREADGVASRANLPPSSMTALLGGISVAEPVEGGADFRFRLVGAQNEARLGFTATGRLMSECYGQKMAAELIALHNRVLADRQPVVLRGRFLGVGLEHALFEALFLPVKASDGKLQVLAGMYDMSEK